MGKATRRRLDELEARLTRMEVATNKSRVVRHARDGTLGFRVEEGWGVPAPATFKWTLSAPVAPKPKPIDFDTLEWGTWVSGSHWHDAESVCGRFIGVSSSVTVRLMLADDEIAYVDPKTATVLRPDEVPG
jgi:hypothetical protein